MMDLSNEQKKVQKAMNASLSGLQEDPWLAQRVLANAKGEEKVGKKISGLVMVVSVLLVLCMATAVAAGVIGWHRGLEDQLRVTEEIRETYKDTELFDQPDLSVTQNGVTITLDQSIVDTNAAYIALRVKGYQPPAEKQPSFELVDYSIDGKKNLITVGESSFFRGLVTGPDGGAVYLDGSKPADFDAIPYTDENGEMVYIISLLCKDGSLIDRTMKVTLQNLGTYVDKAGDMDIDVQGTWTFEWKLKGTDKALDVSGISLPIGKSGSTLTSVHLSPIHIQMSMNVPRDPETTEAAEDAEHAPFLYGMKLKDGTVYHWIADGGSYGYTADMGSDAFQQLWALDRVIDPEEVESLLFSSILDDSGLLEVQIQ